MNRQNESKELIVSGIHLDLTPSLKTFVQEKVDRLFRHEVRIIRMRVELESDPKQEVGKRFTAKGHIKLQGLELNASVSTSECHKSVALLVDKMDRMLRRNSRLTKVKRNHPQPVELAAALPKVA
ncbi:MAG: ribosome-associated translation inhibitor RaiA [Verrucomicrobiota bacterium]